MAYCAGAQDMLTDFGELPTLPFDLAVTAGAQGTLIDFRDLPTLVHFANFDTIH